MNTNELKRFAREARIKLLDQVGRKLEYVITADTAELRGMSNQINDLRTQINKIGKDQVIEKVAYTWFNRLMALRFMDANGYNTPMVVTPIAGYLMPQVLQEAKAGNVEENLQLDRKRLNDLLDGKTQVADAQTEAYKLLLIASCNALNSIMPFMFERISDYTELLLPDDLLSDYSIITDVRNGMTEEDCKQEELIGWLYQFYIADKKDEVFSDLKKNVKITAENIPAATQLFTPRWIVRYMVENTLGKLWLTLKPNSKLKDFMPYYIEAPEGNVPTPLPEGVKEVTDIKFLDPCQGSGHVLVYAFDLFTKIYEEEGYNTNEIPGLILENNLFGIDIDERAAQLAAFALTMKGRSYYARFLRKPVKPNVIALENIDLETIEQTIKLPIAVGEKIINEHDELTLFLLTKAKNFGSLIQIDPEELKILTIEKGSIWEAQQEKLMFEASFLSENYDCVVTNPPYLSNGGMNLELNSFVEKKYPRGKADLMACFIERCIRFSKINGKSAMINQHSWMFLSSFELLRKYLIDSVQFESMLHLGARTFPEIGGEVVQNTSFIIGNYNNSNSGTYIRLTGFNNATLKESKTLEALKNKNSDLFYISKQSFFKSIPSFPFAYWASAKLFEAFEHDKIKDKWPARRGLQTGNTLRFVRFWFEIDYNQIYNDSRIPNDNDFNNNKWFLLNSGGGYRKWYGNIENVVNWKFNGKEIRETGKSLVPNENLYFKKAITWSKVSNKANFRLQPIGILPGDAGPCLYIENDEETFLYILGLLNSKVVKAICEILNPTLGMQSGTISAIPILKTNNEKIVEIVRRNIEISLEDWDFREISYNFKRNIILNQKGNNLETKLEELKKQCSLMFNEIKENEEQLNIIYSKAYGMQDEISNTVQFEEISLFQDFRDSVSNEFAINEKLVITQFISYAIGCVFGRYSIDKDGLIISNQNQSVEDYFDRITNASYKPDGDNIIPVLEAEYFSDDIVGKIKEFLSVVFSPIDLIENVNFIEKYLAKEIRKYLIKDFYEDHLKRFKKRPIYWMFTSPKGHFKALIYMHRYRPDTISTLLNDYLRVYIGKLESEKQSLNQTSISESASAREQTLATKRIAEIEVMLKDLKIYERTLFDYAAKKIEIDLDDGVKVNYLKFKEILVPIKGLDKDEE